MNLENLYGTQESLVKVFERALQQNEPKKVFFQLISIYTRTDKIEVRMKKRQGDHMQSSLEDMTKFSLSVVKGATIF